MMKNIIFILVLLLIFIVAVPDDAFTMMTPKPVVISVDTSKNLGKMPDVLKAGVMSSWWQNIPPLKSELMSLNVKPVWRLHLGIGSDSPGGDSEIKPDNFESAFKVWLNEVVDPKIKNYQDNGRQVVISLTQVPKWLALYPYNERLPYANGDWFFKWAYSPPKDYYEWEKLIKLLVQTQKEDGIKTDYIIWDEPDWMFYGTEEQYLELYGNTIKAIKEVDPNIQVGAPGVSGWSSKKGYNCPAEATGLKDGECPPKDDTMMRALISYVTQNNVPLDFIDWHFPDKNTLPEEVKTTKIWLQEAGLPETMPLTIGEWVFSEKGEAESTEKASAYAIHILKAFQDNGIFRHSATSLYDQEGWISGEWAHVGFFTLDGVIKAKWNSFKGIDKLSGQSIESKTSDERHVIALASKDNEKLTVIASRFIPQGELAYQASLDSFSDQSKNFVQTCLQNIGANLQALYAPYEAYLRSQLSIDDIESASIKHCGSFPDYLRIDFINSKQIAFDVYNGKLSYKPNPREVELKIKNINPGTYNYKKYIIDGDMNEIHSNPCRYNKKTESSPSNTECGINGALDQAVNQAKNDAGNTTINYLLSIGYQQTQVDELMNCLKTPNCNPNDLIENYCQIYPSACPKIKNDLNEAKKLHENLLYNGTYTVANGTTYTIPTFIDQINNLKEVSLEGSKQEKQVTITDGTYAENFIMQPYSVILMELLPVP